MIEHLSSEIILRIFQKLKYMDLINVSEVSKHFNKVATDPKLWEDYDLGKKCLNDKIALPRFQRLKMFKFSKHTIIMMNSTPKKV